MVLCNFRNDGSYFFPSKVSVWAGGSHRLQVPGCATAAPALSSPGLGLFAPAPPAFSGAPLWLHSLQSNTARHAVNNASKPHLTI